MNYLEFSKKVLRDAGFRFTQQRKVVLQLLADSQKSLNAYQIAEKSGALNFSIDVSTVYRILAAFEELNLVHQVGKGYLACKDFACTNQRHCHHQFLCIKCEKVTEFHVDDSSLMKKIQEKLGNVKFSNHLLEVSGICNQCNF